MRGKIAGRAGRRRSVAEVVLDQGSSPFHGLSRFIREEVRFPPKFYYFKSSLGNEIEVNYTPVLSRISQM